MDDPLIIRSKQTIAMPFPGVEVSRSARHSGHRQSVPLRMQFQTRRRVGSSYATSAKEKGVASLQPLD